MLEETLQLFSKDLNKILDSKFFDILIWGSTVLNDFTPHKGDIDFQLFYFRKLEQYIQFHQLF